jgi:hypothetical protein
VNKEFRRDNLPEKPSKKIGERVRIELDPRFDQDVHDLLDPSETVARPQDPEDREAFELDERGRLKLRDPPKRKSGAVKEAADSDCDEEGTEVRQMTKRQMGKAKKPMTIPTAAEKAKTPKGRAEERKRHPAQFSFTPLSPKITSKRNRAVMKAEYRKISRASKRNTPC